MTHGNGMLSFQIRGEAPAPHHPMKEIIWPEQLSGGEEPSWEKVKKKRQPRSKTPGSGRFGGTWKFGRPLLIEKTSPLSPL